MPNDQMRVKHTIRKARRSRMCDQRECSKGIVMGESYMEVKEYRATYRWCLDCWNNKTR